MTRLRSPLAALLYSRRPLDEVKRDGWREIGTLAIATDDPRLDAFERQFLVNLGNRLYGPRNADDKHAGAAGGGR